MENKSQCKKGSSSSNLKGIIKNMDKNIKQEKEAQTPKTLFNNPSVKLGFPEPKKQNGVTLSLKILSKVYDSYENALFSNKQIGPLRSYSYNTYQGLFKKTNEDKIIVVNQIKKPASSKLKTWPKISYFAIFDGHGGEGCSTFLKETYLKYLTENANFPFDIKTSMIEAFQKAEEEFIKQKCKSAEEFDNSGSCALVCILFDNKVYISNIGDSRAIMSMSGGTKIKQLSIDHKPNNPKEFERAIKNGSKIYIDNDDPDRDISKLVFIKDKSEFEKYKNEVEEVIFREYPSDLAVMRTIGDVKVKNKEYGGNPGTIISIPEIFIYDISNTEDFIVMGCDGIFDDLSNQDVVEAAWYIYKNRSKTKNYDIHELTQEACDMIIKYGLEKETSDNLSCIIIGLEGLEKYLKNKIAKDKVSSSLNNFKKDFKRAQTLK
jgi:protein phosphatase 2C family protein 2/3